MNIFLGSSLNENGSYYARNTAKSGGGGIYIISNSTHIENTTFYYNRAYYGGGVQIEYSASLCPTIVSCSFM